MQKILIVDDSLVILNLVKHILESAGYRVSTAVSGEEALTMLTAHGLPHLAIVDINMPGMGGFAFCQKLHQFSDVPVILLSAEQEEEVVVAGLKQYAEDYIIKPSSGPLRAEELKARVATVLKRAGDYSYPLAPLVEIDPRLQINFPNRVALVAGEEVKLTPTESKLLHILTHYAGRTLSFAFLLQRLWPAEEAFEERLHTHVYRLRKKIEADPRNPIYVLSEWGVGYQFVRQADVR